jgi:hypothetical protein
VFCKKRGEAWKWRRDRNADNGACRVIAGIIPQAHVTHQVRSVHSVLWATMTPQPLRPSSRRAAAAPCVTTKVSVSCLASCTMWRGTTRRGAHPASGLWVRTCCMKVNATQHCFLFSLRYTCSVRGYAIGGAVGWGTALQAGRSLVRFPMESLEVFSDNPSGRIVALGSTQPLIEMSTRNTSWG